MIFSESQGVKVGWSKATGGEEKTRLDYLTRVKQRIEEEMYQNW
jgi:hypothetical protein